MMARLGGAEGAAKGQARLQRIGAQEGIAFQFGGVIGSTRPAHRLLHVVHEASGVEAQNRVSEALFAAHFEQERDITDPATLVGIAEAAGLDGPAIRESLSNAEVAASVDEQAASAREAGLVGVPHFTIAGTDHVDGAGDVQDLYEAFVRVKELGGEDKKAEGTVGAFCEIGGDAVSC